MYIIQYLCEYLQSIQYHPSMPIMSIVLQKCWHILENYPHLHCQSHPHIYVLLQAFFQQSILPPRKAPYATCIQPLFVTAHATLPIQNTYFIHVYLVALYVHFMSMQLFIHHMYTFYSTRFQLVYTFCEFLAEFSRINNQTLQKTCIKPYLLTYLPFNVWKPHGKSWKIPIFSLIFHKLSPTQTTNGSRKYVFKR